MKIFFIIFEIIFFVFYRIIKKIENYHQRFFFLFEKKKILIPFKNIINLSSISISNLRKVNQNKYENEVLHFLEEKSKSKNYFFDIGAHYGFYTINLQKYFDKIYSFEANPLNYEILKYNIQKKKFKNTKIHNFFIGKKNISIDFLMSYNSYLSQVDKKSFLSEELYEFCKDGFYYQNKKDFESIYNYCYTNLITKKFYLNFFYLFKNLFINFKEIKKLEIIEKLKLVRRYNKYYERYICEKIKINSKSFDEIFFNEFKNSLIKIDVEGSEINVIKGMENFINNFKPDIFCEIGHNHNEIIGLLKNYGYAYEKIDWKSFYFTVNNKV